MNTMTDPNIPQSNHVMRRSSRIPLRAGSWSMDFLDGDLRNISLNQVEIVQRLCVLVRGPEWETLPHVITSSEIEANERSFTIICDCESRIGEIDFRWRLRAQGSEEGEIHYELNGAAFSSFLANRIGICLLHSTAEFCGRMVRITTQDGTTQTVVLPEQIAPWPIFTDAVSISYQIDKLPEVCLSLSGDCFEAEDQRNWGDASFKIYSRPLRLPHPYPIEKGSSIAQSARLTLASPVPAHADTPETNLFHISVLCEQQLPQIGLGFSGATELSSHQLSLLRELRPAFFSVKYDQVDPHREELMASAASVAKALNVPLEIRLATHSKEGFPTEQLLDKTPVCRWLVEIDSQLDHSAHVLRPGNAPVYWGSRKGFVEINRNQWMVQRGEGVWFSFNPQIHASDIDSLIESLPAQAAVTREARRLANGKYVAVSPITLGCSIAHGFTVDPRHSSLFGAAWTVGSVKYLAEGGADSVACFDAVGHGGVIPDGTAPMTIDSPELTTPAVYPVYHVLSAVAEFNGGESLFTRSTNPSRIEGIALRARDRIRALLTNFSQEDQLVSIQTDISCEWTRSLCLNEPTCLEALENPVHWRTARKIIKPVAGMLEVIVPPLGIVILDGNVGEAR